MSQVNRYYVGKYGLVEGESLGRLSVVLSSDFDTLQSRLDDTERQRFDEQKACVAAERLVVELQQRLTAADERADVLEGLLRRAAAFTHDFENPISLRRDIDAALKPADVFVDPLNSCDVCGGEHICPGCGAKGWTANCDQCVPY
jgi:hypothetical protein